MKRNRLELPTPKSPRSCEALTKEVRQLREELDRLLDEVLQDKAFRTYQ